MAERQGVTEKMKEENQMEWVGRMNGMELSEFLHDNYPDILIVIFSGFGEFEYAKKAIRYNVSEYMLKPVTAMELTKVLRNMKEKLDSRKKEQKKMESLSQTSKDYHKNVDVIRSKALETLVNCTRDVQVSLLELKKLGISFDCSSYRVAVFDSLVRIVLILFFLSV